MKVIKLAAISIIVFAVIIILFSLLIPADVRISRAITIIAPREKIIDQISDLRNWKNWNQMVLQQDSGLGRYDTDRYYGPQLTVRTRFVSEDSVLTVWNNHGSPPIQSGFNMVHALSDTSVVQWYFDFHQKWYPWEKFGSIIFDQQLGPGMENSLKSLKEEVEKAQ